MPSGPDGPPVVGNYLAFVREPLEFMTRSASRYGDIVAWEEIDGPIYQLNYPSTSSTSPSGTTSTTSKARASSGRSSRCCKSM